MKKLRIKQVRSTIRNTRKQKETIKALGLGKIGKTVEQNDTPQTRGMINKVSHLVESETID